VAILMHKKQKKVAAVCLALRTRTVASFWTVARRDTVHLFFNDLTRLQGVVHTVQRI
jgi:hypothetical protein